MNEYWVKPLADETPEVAENVESGCHYCNN
jgi:hypothetical protein